MTRKEELEEIIRNADTAYYVDGSPVMSDSEYDNLKAELAELCPDDPILQSLGDDSVPTNKVEHKIPMLSLQKIQESRSGDDGIETLASWVISICDRYKEECSVGEDTATARFLVEPKVDGMSAEATYINGKLKVVSTRGRGTYGDDITANTRHCFPEDLGEYFHDWPELNVRGELYISKENFNRINTDEDEQFANARNLCAGLVKAKEISENTRLVSFIAHGIGYYECPVEKASSSLCELLCAIEQHSSIQTIHPHVVANPEGVIARIESLRDPGTPYWTDGAVIKLDNMDGWPIFGETSHHPRWAVAYKFIPETATTTVKAISWQIGGRTGKLVPVAEIDPVLISGSKVSRVTLHNAGLAASRGIKVGASVIIEKANEIIPHVVSVNNPEPYELAPRIRCPFCAGIANLVAGKTENTADYFCSGATCPGRRVSELRDGFGVNGLHVLGIGPEICTAFVADNFATTVLDVVMMPMEEYPDSIGEKTKENIHQELRKARSAPFSAWLYALNIPGLGAAGCKQVSSKFKNFRHLLEACESGLITSVGLNDRVASSVSTFMLAHGSSLVNQFMEAAFMPTSDNYSEPSMQTCFTGKNIVVTGAFEAGRSYVEKFVNKIGATLKSGVSKKVDFVVAGSEPGGTKISKAEALGIRIISEDEFFNMLKHE